MGHKTYTSNEVKDRYNRKHYEQVMLRVAIGGRDAIQTMAAYHGLSVAEYIRHLVITDAKQTGNGDISAILGGGVTEYYRECCELRQLPVIPFVAD
nr:unnamed protein product [uncultured bacterium]